MTFRNERRRRGFWLVGLTTVLFLGIWLVVSLNGADDEAWKALLVVGWMPLAGVYRIQAARVIVGEGRVRVVNYFSSTRVDLVDVREIGLRREWNGTHVVVLRTQTDREVPVRTFEFQRRGWEPKFDRWVPPMADAIRVEQTKLGLDEAGLVQLVQPPS